jgi:hypothetical protein
MTRASPSAFFPIIARGFAPFRNARAVGAYEASIARFTQEEVS